MDALLATDEVAYVGGFFEQIGPYTGSLGAVSQASGELLDGNLPVVADGAVEAMVGDGLGGWFVGGSFQEVDGKPCPALAHVRADGLLDEGWCTAPRSNGRSRWALVSALARAGSTLYVGGGFTRIAGERRLRLAAFDVASGLLLAWDPQAKGRILDLPGEAPFGPGISEIAVRGSTVYVGGFFERVGGKPRLNVAAVDAQTGHATAWNPEAGPFSGFVEALIVVGRSVYLGGWFNEVGGKRRDGLARVRADGTVTRWNPRVDQAVTAIDVAGGTVFIGGPFRRVGNERRRGLAEVNAQTGNPSAWAPPALENQSIIRAITVEGDTVYAGGDFELAADRASRFVVAIDVASGTRRDWQPRPNGAVSTIVVSDDQVLIGGDLTGIGGEFRNCLAAIDIGTGEITAWDPDVQSGTGDDPGHIHALAAEGPLLYVGGTFDRVGGQPRADIAALDRTTGKPSPWAPVIALADGFPRVTALAMANDTVYAGGDFQSVNNQSRPSIAALDAATGAVLPWNPGISTDDIDRPEVNVVLAHDGLVYVGGEFTKAGGADRKNLAAVDAKTGEATDWNPGPTSDSVPSTHALAIQNSRLYVGGYFNGIAGVPQAAIAAFDLVTGQLDSWNPQLGSDSPIGLPPAVYAIAGTDTSIYIGGSFDTIAGKPRQRGLAALQPSTAKATDWTPSLSALGWRLAATSTTLFAARYQGIIAAFPLRQPQKWRSR